jgi:hypothetical protein
MNVIIFAKEILLMQSRIEDLEYENSRLRMFEDKYNTMLDESLEHSQRMVGTMLKLVMTPGVIEACQKSKEVV